MSNNLKNIVGLYLAYVVHIYIYNASADKTETHKKDFQDT